MATHPLRGMGPAEEADAEKFAETDILSWLVLMMETIDLGGDFNCRRGRRSRPFCPVGKGGEEESAHLPRDYFT